MTQEQTDPSPTAFRASYADWKLIRTRQTVQVVFEIPLSEADAAYNVLGGMPNSASESWFGIAALSAPQTERSQNPLPIATPQPAPDKPSAGAKRMEWRELQPAAQAGIRCADPVFMKFLDETYTTTFRKFVRDPARTVRYICCVESRSELSTKHVSRMIWKQLDDQFLAWKHVDA